MRLRDLLFPVGARGLARLTLWLIASPVLLSAAEPESVRATLKKRMDAFVARPDFDRALLSVKVVSLDHGDVLYSHNEEMPMSPASNAKLYVGALALDRLGADYCIKTPVLSTAPPDANGVIRGDLIVAGRGDPLWNTRWQKRDFWSLFDPFIAVLERAGVRTITGDIVADATYFRVSPAGEGWAASDLNSYFGAEISAISLEDNYADLRVTPAASVGQPGKIEILQPGTGIQIDNRTETVAAGGMSSLRVVRLPGEKVAHVFGSLPLGEGEKESEVTVPRPASWFAAALKDALVRRGIKVNGMDRSVRWPEPSVERPGLHRLGEVSSPPMRECVKAFMKPSQNLEADLVFLHVGEQKRQTTSPLQADSNDLALQELHAFLRDHELRADDVRFDEGSGLSRNDLTTAAATVSLLRFMATHPEHAAFQEALPVAGIDGTLRKRLKGTRAEGNLRAKTGSLRWAYSLSGYFTTIEGEPWVMSIMLNRYSPLNGPGARQEIDEMVGLITGHEGK